MCYYVQRVKYVQIVPKESNVDRIKRTTVQGGLSLLLHQKINISEK